MSVSVIMIRPSGAASSKERDARKETTCWITKWVIPKRNLSMAGIKRWKKGYRFMGICLTCVDKSPVRSFLLIESLKIIISYLFKSFNFNFSSRIFWNLWFQILFLALCTYFVKLKEKCAHNTILGNITKFFLENLLLNFINLFFIA